MCIEFSAAFQNYSVTLKSDPAAIILVNCHRLAGDRYQQWLMTVPLLEEDQLEAVQTCEELERLFVEALKQMLGMGGDLQTPECVGLQPWAGMVKLQPVLFTWVQEQCKGMASLIDKMATHERWDRPVSAALHVSKSVTEMERLTDTALTVRVLRFRGSGVEGSVGRTGVYLGVGLEGTCAGGGKENCV